MPWVNRTTAPATRLDQLRDRFAAGRIEIDEFEREAGELLATGRADARALPPSPPSPPKPADAARAAFATETVAR